MLSPELSTLCRLVCVPDRVRPVVEAASTDDARRLIDLARAHGVEAWLAGMLAGMLAGADPETGHEHPAWAELAAQRLRFVAAAGAARVLVTDFAAVADPRGIDWAVLKGLAAAETLYPKVSMRYGVDTDVLVRPGDFERCVAALESAGWIVVDCNWPLLARTEPAQLRLRSPAGGLLDLHWHLIAERGHRRAVRLDTDELLGRRLALASGLVGLDPVDQALHLGVHAALSGADRLTWLLDTALAAARVRSAGRWAELVDRAHRSATAPALALVLLRAVRWLPELAGPVADSAGLGALAGPGWRRFCRSVDRVSPLGEDPRRPSLARAVARSVRGSGAASLAEVLRHGSAYLRAGAPGARQEAWLSDPTDPRSSLYPVDAPAARSRYFTAVAGC